MKFDIRARSAPVLTTSEWQLISRLCGTAVDGASVTRFKLLGSADQSFLPDPVFTFNVLTNVGLRHIDIAARPSSFRHALADSVLISRVQWARRTCFSASSALPDCTISPRSVLVCAHSHLRSPLKQVPRTVTAVSSILISQLSRPICLLSCLVMLSGRPSVSIRTVWS
ncbi:hypothetical protein AcW1_005996 [Taiwanofungus camphoratus]|nr:hypothetical protein AcW1_005996 [Antrodia cinnamomea]